MEENSVVFKGTVNGLTILLKEEESFTNLLDEIENKISSAGSFFKGVKLNVKYRGKKLEQEEEMKVFELLSEKSGAVILGVEEDLNFEEIKNDKRENSNVANNSSSITNKSDLLYSNIVKNSYFKGIDEGATKFYRGTVRSGQLIKFDGNVVVVGDVNPGGEISATGNALILGALRGIVHAGADGNKDAVVVASNLQPTQLRIADVITRPPDGEHESNKQYIPEIAFVRDDIVYIERYLPQR